MVSLAVASSNPGSGSRECSSSKRKQNNNKKIIKLTSGTKEEKRKINRNDRELLIDIESRIRIFYPVRESVMFVLNSEFSTTVTLTTDT